MLSGTPTTAGWPIVAEAVQTITRSLRDNLRGVFTENAPRLERPIWTQVLHLLSTSNAAAAAARTPPPPSKPTDTNDSDRTEDGSGASTKDQEEEVVSMANVALRLSLQEIFAALLFLCDDSVVLGPLAAPLDEPSSSATPSSSSSASSSVSSSSPTRSVLPAKGPYRFVIPRSPVVVASRPAVDDPAAGIPTAPVSTQSEWYIDVHERQRALSLLLALTFGEAPYFVSAAQVIQGLYPLLIASPSSSSDAISAHNVTASSAPPPSQNHIAESLFGNPRAMSAAGTKRFARKQSVVALLLNSVLFHPKRQMHSSSGQDGGGGGGGVAACIRTLLFDDRIGLGVTAQAAALVAAVVVPDSLPRVLQLHQPDTNRETKTNKTALQTPPQEAAVGVKDSTTSAPPSEATYSLLTLSMSDYVCRVAPDVLWLLSQSAASDTTTSPGGNGTSGNDASWFQRLQSARRAAGGGLTNATQRPTANPTPTTTTVLSHETLEERLHLVLVLILNRLTRLPPKSDATYALCYQRLYHTNRLILGPAFALFRLPASSTGFTVAAGKSSSSTEPPPISTFRNRSVEEVYCGLLRLRAVCHGASLTAANHVMLSVWDGAAGFVVAAATALIRDGLQNFFTGGDDGGAGSSRVAVVVTSSSSSPRKLMTGSAAVSLLRRLWREAAIAVGRAEEVGTSLCRAALRGDDDSIVQWKRSSSSDENEKEGWVIAQASSSSSSTSELSGCTDQQRLGDRLQAILLLLRALPPKEPSTRRILSVLFAEAVSAAQVEMMMMQQQQEEEGPPPRAESDAACAAPPQPAFALVTALFAAFEVSQLMDTQDLRSVVRVSTSLMTLPSFTHQCCVLLLSVLQPVLLSTQPPGGEGESRGARTAEMDMTADLTVCFRKIVGYLQNCKERLQSATSDVETSSAGFTLEMQQLLVALEGHLTPRDYNHDHRDEPQSFTNDKGITQNTAPSPSSPSSLSSPAATVSLVHALTARLTALESHLAVRAVGPIVVAVMHLSHAVEQLTEVRYEGTSALLPLSVAITLWRCALQVFSDFSDEEALTAHVVHVVAKSVVLFQSVRALMGEICATTWTTLGKRDDDDKEEENKKQNKPLGGTLFAAAAPSKSFAVVSVILPPPCPHFSVSLSSLLKFLRVNALLLEVLLGVCDMDRSGGGTALQQLDRQLEAQTGRSIARWLTQLPLFAQTIRGAPVVGSVDPSTKLDAESWRVAVQVAALHVIGPFAQCVGHRVDFALLCQLTEDVFRHAPHPMCRAAATSMLVYCVSAVTEGPQEGGAAAVGRLDAMDLSVVQKLAAHMAQYRSKEATMHDEAVRFHGRWILERLRAAGTALLESAAARGGGGGGAEEEMQRREMHRTALRWRSNGLNLWRNGSEAVLPSANATSILRLSNKKE